MTDFIKRQKSNSILYIFLISLTVSQILFIISLIISDGYAMDSVVYYYFTDTFMDFFSVEDAVISGNPYDRYYAIYPPLAYLIHKFISIFIYGSNDNYTQSGITVSNDLLYAFLLYNIFSVIILSIIIYNAKKGPVPVKVWYLMLIMFSFPFLFNYERGNLILISVTFSFLFFLGYDSEKKYIRELSYLALAVSAAIKIYPALFGLFILKKKRFKEAFHCIIYGILIFFLPCFAFGGPGIFKSLISHLNETSGIANRVDIFSGINAISMSMGMGPVTNPYIKYGLYGIIIILLMITVFISKSAWRSLLAVILLSICAPFFSYAHSLTFLVIPLTKFLDTDEKRTSIDYIYLFLFVVIYAPIAIENMNISLPGNANFVLSLNSYLTTVAVILMIIMLCIETLLIPLSGISISRNSHKESGEGIN